MQKAINFTAIAIVCSLFFYGGFVLGEESAQADCLERLDGIYEQVQQIRRTRESSKLFIEFDGGTLPDSVYFKSDGQ